MHSVVCLSVCALSLSGPISLPPLWHTWQQQRGQAVFPADKYSDTPCLTGRVHQAGIGMDRLRVCIWICVCVCDSLVVSMVPGQRSESAWEAQSPAGSVNLDLCCSHPFILPPRRSHNPLLPASSAHPEEEGWALLSCQSGNADMHRLASLHLEQSPSSTLISPSSLFLPSVTSPFLCCLNYMSSQSSK